MIYNKNDLQLFSDCRIGAFDIIITWHNYDVPTSSDDFLYL